MNDMMKPYIDLIAKILETGDVKNDRTKTGTLSLFGEQIKFDVREFAPFLTQRKLTIKSTIGELLWFMEGSTNARRLKVLYNCNFWDEWSSPIDGDIGPMYGYQWRKRLNDQLVYLIDTLAKDPDSRRLLVCSWDSDTLPIPGYAPCEQPAMGLGALPPCHFAYQLNTAKDRNSDNEWWVDLQLYQRSCDLLVGGPINIAMYYVLQVILCKIANVHPDANGRTYKPRTLTITYGDVHVYNNHIEKAKILIGLPAYPPATFNPQLDFTNFLSRIESEGPQLQTELFAAVTGYKSGPVLKFERNI